MAEKLRVRLKSVDAQSLSATIPVPAIVQGGANIHVSDSPKENGKDAFSTGGAYVLQQEINRKANIEDIPTIPDIPTVPTKVSELENDSGFVSASELEEKHFISEESLNNKGFVTEENIQEKGFITEATLDNKGFLKEQDIKGLATEEYVNGIVGEINQVLDMINGEVV